jgi:hypothetical protein
MTASITATVPSKFVGDHRSDLLLVGLLKAAGIPAVSVSGGFMATVNTSAPGILTSVKGATDTVFTWTPKPVAPSAEDVELTALHANATSAAAMITELQARATTAEGHLATVTAELATANTKAASLATANAALTSQIATLSKQPSAAEPTPKPAA